ncbi:putative dolichyl pyrophosphate Glc1Man9GlcNAc2 alpha-1,3-glucosyltransferase [Echinococcus granulosus]|nr:putative dolichyl pyrophosphate Glc1Man9GlcNAc2 alpha-1,3-glucosyltransferase [Echinococcus granulosus]
MLFDGILIILASAAFKSLLFGAYHSTDFEVHRNWLAITYCTNISEWYSEATSKWTLDYPPFFAYFEWALAQIGSKLDPKMVVLSTETYSSLTTIYFQRITVLLSECLLLYSICSMLHKIFGPLGDKARITFLTATFLFAFNFGLLVVDHIHFQYNGFLFGILFLSILKAFQGNFLWSGFWFSVLLNFKHIFVYVAPVYFVFMLFHYCLKRESGRVKVVLGRLFLMAAVVGIVFTVSLAPFIYWGKLAELLARLFPFQRGLCHSYWAPNFWALYNAADKMFSASGLFSHLCLRQPTGSLENQVPMTSGLTGNYEHLCLLTIRPLHTALLTALFMLPSLVFCQWHRDGMQAVDSGFILLRSIVAAAWASFLFGWHVHEKAVLMITLPLTFLAVASRRLRGIAFYVNTVAHFSLLPLIFTPNEQPIVLSSYLLYTLTQYLLLGRSSNPVTGGLLSTLWPELTSLARIHLLGLIPLLAVNRILLPRVYPHLEFLPLMLTSVYCAVGLLVAFLVYIWINFVWFWREKQAEVEDEGENQFYQAKESFFKKND